MTTSVFISYARGDDEAFAWRLYEELKNATGPEGPLFDVWFDRVSTPSRSLTFHQEIRDAVHTSDRLILVVGTKAITSDYVKQEWQFAYYAANKCVNPIVRLDEAIRGLHACGSQTLLSNEARQRQRVQQAG